MDTYILYVISVYQKFTVCKIDIALAKPEAYEPPKAAKEHETYTACRVLSQSKLFAD